MDHQRHEEHADKRTDCQGNECRSILPVPGGLSFRFPGFSSPIRPMREKVPKIFLTGQYSYRRPSVFFAGLAALTCGVVALVSLVISALHATWNWQAFATVAFVGGIGGVMAYVGGMLLYFWITRMVNVLEISSAGIRYGKNFVAWDQVQRLGGANTGKGVQLFFHKRSRGPMSSDRHLMITPELTTKQYEQLIQRLRTALADQYPEVQFG
jgi:hypothetical protein